MTYVISICIDHEENVVANLTNRLHANFTVLATIVRSLKCGTQEDASSIFEAKTSFFESAAALGFVPLEKHCPNYALSVVGSRTAAYQIGFVSHCEVHRSGDEAAWWVKTGIDPTVPARVLWLESHPLPKTTGGFDQGNASRPLGGRSGTGCLAQCSHVPY